MCSASNVKLAETLQTVANEGARTFYDPSSALAQNLVKDIQAKGGIITLEDLSSYYHNFTVKVSSLGPFLLFQYIYKHIYIYTYIQALS
jgi:gamma-glutamyltranspeptidase